MSRISPATVTFGVMAIVLGLVAAYVVRQSLQKPPVAAVPAPVRAPAPPPDPGIRVAMLKHNLPMHALITEDDVQHISVPRDFKNIDLAIKSMQIAVGRITNKPLKAGQVLRDEHLLGVGEGLPALAERIPAGYRAVTIQAAGAETGGKRLSEGDLVDISMTVEGTHPDLGEVLTRTLLKGVLVVDAAAGNPIVRDARRDNSRQSETITIAVLPADANKLMVAQKTGDLSVALCSAADPAADDDADSITRRELLGLKEIPAPVVVPAPKKYMVEKWSGGKMSVVEMSDDRVRESRQASGEAMPGATPAAGAETTAAPSGVKATTNVEPSQAAAL